MTLLSRTDDSLLARWWWTVDRWLLLALALLLASGLVLVFGSSPAKAQALGLAPFYFAIRHMVYLGMALALMILVSLLDRQGVRRVGVVLFAASLILTASTLAVADDYNGAARWLDLGGISLQPAEFLKPGFVIVCAWLLSGAIESPGFPGRTMVSALFALSAGLLLLQPDFGQTVLLGAAFGFLLVLAGLPTTWIAGLAAAGLGGIGLAYVSMPHVAERIDRFLDPSSGDSYQVDAALNAFRAGGLFGRGPGEGAIKKALPEAHTDYIFAVAGEEFGAVACLSLLAIFGVIVVRGLARLSEEDDPFTLLATSGLFAMFGLQALVNIAVNLSLLPSKGMTLPFVSYGGSSMLALGLAMGMVLALTRRNRFEGRSRMPARRWA